MPLTKQNSKNHPGREARSDERARPVFYTINAKADESVEIWLNEPQTTAGPLFYGSIGGAAVELWERESLITGSYLAIFGQGGGLESGANQIGSANVVMNNIGRPRFVINIKHNKTRLWASISKMADETLLIRCGFRPERLTGAR